MNPELIKAALLVESMHRHCDTGKVDWDAVATERKIPSAAAARMQYQRLITRCKKFEEELEANGGGGGDGDRKGKKRKTSGAGKSGKSGRAKRGKKAAEEEENGVREGDKEGEEGGQESGE